MVIALSLHHISHSDPLHHYSIYCYRYPVHQSINPIPSVISGNDPNLSNCTQIESIYSCIQTSTTHRRYTKSRLISRIFAFLSCRSTSSPNITSTLVTDEDNHQINTIDFKQQLHSIIYPYFTHYIIIHLFNNISIFC